MLTLPSADGVHNTGRGGEFKGDEMRPSRVRASRGALRHTDEFDQARNVGRRWRREEGDRERNREVENHTDGADPARLALVPLDASTLRPPQ